MIVSPVLAKNVGAKDSLPKIEAWVYDLGCMYYADLKNQRRVQVFTILNNEVPKPILVVSVDNGPRVVSVPKI